MQVATDGESTSSPTATSADSADGGTSGGPGSASGSDTTATNADDTTSTSTGDGDAEPTVALAAAYCEKLFGCCDAGELAAAFDDQDPAPASEAECLEVMTGLVEAEVSSIQRQEAAGRVVLDLELMKPCADALATAGCDTWRANGDLFRSMVDDRACAGLVRPLLEVGEACQHDRECLSTVCDEFNGACFESVGQGEPCGPALCVQPFYCGSGAGGSTCVPDLDEGDPCMADAQCPWHVCDGTCIAVCDGA